MKTYILVDSENTPLQHADFARDESVELLIFIGKTQTKFPRELVLAVQAMGTRARYVEMSGSGKNALDFHLAFYLGQLSTQDPSARFFIVSKDTGFDPLVVHLAAQGTSVRRVPDAAAFQSPPPRPARAPAAKPAPVASAKAVAQSSTPPTETGERADYVSKRLKASPKSRPARLKTLQSTIQALLGQEQPLSEDDLRGIVAALQTRGVLSVSDTKISYPSPA
ncbi:MAG: hypothetical protein RIQ79_1939 [Verrucomicrobiota bacterium]